MTRFGATAGTLTVNVSDAESPLVSVAVTLSAISATAAGTVPVKPCVAASNVSQDGRGWPLAKVAA
jgi:hypothetical protein